MTTLREKIADVVDETVEPDGRGGSITSSVTLDAVIAAVIEHATSDEAVERANNAWVEKNETHGYDPSNYHFRAAIRAAIEGE